ncbi:MAG TPA: phosphotransferase [Symbiobacteriaceae bacterium]|nr:phosphotransferase [Symbiobacteriaceae bacterium]
MIPGAVLRAFGLPPDRLRPVASAYRLEAAYRAGSVLLKPYRYGERQLYYATLGLRHLERRGCRLVPRLVETLDGRPYIRVEGIWYYATTWIPGRRPRWPADLAGAAESLAAFHTASEGCFIPYSAGRSWRVRWNALLEDLVTFLRLARSGGSEFDRLYVSASLPFLEQATRAVAALAASEYDALEAACRRRPAFCHRDLTSANLIVDLAGRVCLVDPDTWGPELRVYDLARLLLAGAGADAGRALGAVAAYEALLPLAPAERQLLPWAYLLPREYWWAGVCRYRRPSAGVDPEALLRQAMAGAGARAACAAALEEALA